MSIYRIPTYQSTDLEINESTEGETIEGRVERILNNNEPITDKAPEIYNEHLAGAEDMRNQFDIRHDKWDEAAEQTSSMYENNHKSNIIDINKGLRSEDTTTKDDDQGGGDASEA